MLIMSFLKKKTFPKQLTNSQIIVITPYQHHLNSFDENEWGRSKLHDGSVSSSFYREVYCIASLNQCWVNSKKPELNFSLIIIGIKIPPKIKPKSRLNSKNQRPKSSGLEDILQNFYWTSTRFYWMSSRILLDVYQNFASLLQRSQNCQFHREMQ